VHASPRVTGVLICAGQVQADWKRVSGSAHPFHPMQICGFAYVFLHSLGCFGTPALPGARGLVYHCRCAGKALLATGALVRHPCSVHPPCMWMRSLGIFAMHRVE